LRDLVSYDGKHNEANGEDNRDGTDKNVSWNCGVEGPTEDANVNALRERQMRNFLATLLLSQGVPMLLGGDPVGHTQGGNNNAYCQDNELGWINWDLAPSQASLLAFTRKLIELRKRHPLFRRRSFFQGADVNGTKVKDIVWLTPDGREMKEEEWQQSFARCLGVHLSGVGLTETDARGGSLRDGDFLWLLNSHHEPIPFVLPALHETTQWRVLIDTRYEQEPPAELCATGSAYPLDGRSLVLLQAADETHT
jgi:glycogen operon protein